MQAVNDTVNRQRFKAMAFLIFMFSPRCIVTGNHSLSLVLMHNGFHLPELARHPVHLPISSD
jgi:hypothetical protein